MKILKRLWDRITTPFISIAVLIDESRRIDEDGSWSGENKKERRRKRRETE